MNRSTSLLFPLLLLVLVPMSASSAQKPAEAAPPDPTKAEVSLPASAGWCASLVYESDVGIWTNGPIACLPRHGHTLVGGDLSPTRPGRELLLFTRDGEVHDVRPRGDGSFDAPQTATLQGRVRQALILPTAEGRAARIVAACRTGELLLLGLEESGLTTRLLLERPMGFGRIALRPPLPGAPSVLYLTRDDGVILRLEERADGTWSDEIIYAGPQGPRGIAAGRFAADSATETVAVFGYSKKVQLLARTADGPWRVETIFEDRDKGHWLATAELDGRNGTDELIASGYGGRLVLLSRPAGYGLPGRSERSAGGPRRSRAPAVRRSGARVPCSPRRGRSPRVARARARAVRGSSLQHRTAPSPEARCRRRAGPGRGG